MRGRRRVGKSRLVEHFITQVGCPAFFFAASRQADRELALFAEELATSTLANHGVGAGQAPTTWDGALRLLAAALPDDQASVVVIDEFPYLLEDECNVDASFQKAWDRHLSNKPVLLVLIGSDLAMMEALDQADQPLYQRGTEMIVGPLSPAETATIVGANASADAFDAYLITGGLPLICGEWPRQASTWEYLEGALREPMSALIVSGERALAAEFPAEILARSVLSTIGSGERTFSNIARAGGGMAATSLHRSLDLLAAKRLVVRETPLSTRPSKEARYRVADPYLRFWLRFIGPHLAEIERGRGDRVLHRIETGWSSWRGRAVEPVVRESLNRMLPVNGLPTADVVGGFWTRTNDPEIDIVAADRGPIAQRIAFTGTIKWLDDEPLTQADLDRCIADSAEITGVDGTQPCIAVSRNGVTATGAAATFGPEDLLATW